MEIKVNDYVRTKEGYICKILEIHNEYSDDYLDWNDINSASIRKSHVVKNSPKIIDLIEVGDYVNGKRVNFVYNPDGKQVFRIEFDVDGLKGHMICETKHIKSILTKEQFEQMEYKID